ncbi:MULTISPECIES: dTDP-4-dehydrorhamnose reductase [Pseudoxanthomonas]|uniref:dTDP-4-dehydrorhamnose reductase n=1 Tax=Pseudoxanthomonas winnipegensis TaxID=2480810 RepID=A0AAW8GGB2_9GAMM|nr:MULTISPECIES: dTDP-4-dehydrorhamnose reductase [Pseudoxanthomonas]MDQ1120300.1 dTDP-4-dehydrorhamnose reductase [Pseudoxanthomonas winnipegensis]MDQ1133515.1 dTDP-4-dehydrorhamnose reductase [Pseudoxanthomonas winnipegensis]MDR6140243.1 dTDP-4-dehydrorhamnose reductase [Pseudoxanthomonas sp. SORGH_AS_0997]
MTLLLLGANGQVGRELRRALAPLGEVVCTTRSGTLEDGAVCEVADFDRPESLPALLDRLAPAVVVNAAAYTAVDKAEEDRDAAFRANAESPGALARWCAAHGVPLVHYSTDYVFDGRGTAPYAVDAPTAPLGVYGASKLAGEEAVRAAGGQHLIFRTAWVYASHGKNFLLTMLRVGAQRDELRVVADQIGTPTSAALIADVTAQVLRQGTKASGTWHLTAAGQTSWHGFAEAIFARAVAAGLLPRAPQVMAIPTSEYPTPARRPAYSCLDTTSLQRDFGIDLPAWETALDSVVAELA